MKSENKYISIGRRIREIREERGLSQKTLAESVGFETSTSISLIESGERRVSIEDLEKISMVLRMDINYFLGGETDKKNVQYALRASKDLSESDRKALLHFYELARKKKHERRD